MHKNLHLQTNKQKNIETEIVALRYSPSVSSKFSDNEDTGLLQAINLCSVTYLL